MKEIYFEKAVCKAKRTFIPAYMIISMIYHLKGKSLILSKIGCFLPERSVTGLWQAQRSSPNQDEIHFIQRSGTEALVLKRISFFTDSENYAWNPPRELWPERACLGWMGKGTPFVVEIRLTALVCCWALRGSRAG